MSKKASYKGVQFSYQDTLDSDTYLDDLGRRKILYKEGDKVYCMNNHFIASVAKDIIENENCGTELFNFAENQDFKHGDDLRCKICGELFTKDDSPWVTLNIKD